jgi:hypothetical protein
MDQDELPRQVAKGRGDNPHAAFAIRVRLKPAITRGDLYFKLIDKLTLEWGTEYQPAIARRD